MQNSRQLVCTMSAKLISAEQSDNSVQISPFLTSTHPDGSHGMNRVGDFDGDTVVVVSEGLGDRVGVSVGDGVGVGVGGCLGSLPTALHAQSRHSNKAGLR